jgi:hypothetical protein
VKYSKSSMPRRHRLGLARRRLATPRSACALSYVPSATRGARQAWPEPLLIELARRRLRVSRRQAGAPIHAAGSMCIAGPTESAFSRSILYSPAASLVWSRLGRGGSRGDPRPRAWLLPLGPGAARAPSCASTVVTVPAHRCGARHDAKGRRHDEHRPEIEAPSTRLRSASRCSRAKRRMAQLPRRLGVRVTADGRYDVDSLAPGSWQISGHPRGRRSGAQRRTRDRARLADEHGARDSRA